MSVKVFDSEYKVLEILWKEGDLTAGQLAILLKEQIGWSRNTTYTVIGKLVDKGVVERYGTNFSCKALITKREVQQSETMELINKFFDGSKEDFLSAFLSDNEQLKSTHSENEHLTPVYTKPLYPNDQHLINESNRLKLLIRQVKDKWKL